MFNPAVHSFLLDILIVFALFWLVLSTAFVIVVVVKVWKIHKQSQHVLELVKNIGLAIWGSGALLGTFAKVVFNKFMK